MHIEQNRARSRLDIFGMEIVLGLMFAGRQNYAIHSLVRIECAIKSPSKQIPTNQHLIEQIFVVYLQFEIKELCSFGFAI